MYLDTLLSIFVLMAKLKVLFIVSNIGDYQSLKLSRCFPMNIRGSGAYQLLPIQLFFLQNLNVCLHFSQFEGFLAALEYSKQVQISRRLSSKVPIMFAVPYKGRGGGWPSQITEFFRKFVHIISYWSILGSMGFLNVFITLTSFDMINS